MAYTRGVLAAVAALAFAAPSTAGAHTVPGIDSCTPPKDPPAGDVVTSDNVEYMGWLPGEAGDMTPGGRLAGRWFVMTGMSHLSVYDTIEPEKPKLVGRVDFPCRFENEDVAVTPDGNWAMFSDFATTGALYVFDLRDKSNPKLAAELAGAGTHTSSCALDCRLLLGSYKASGPAGPLSGGEVVDLSDPTAPKALGDWTAGDVLPTRKVHDLTEVAPGILLAASQPMVLLDVRGNPVEPKVLARGLNEDKRYHSVEWPREGKDRWLMASFETNATPRCELGVGDFTVFDSATMKPVSTFLLDNDGPADPPFNAGLGCSPHWFQTRPSWKDGGIVALAAYDHGVRFLRVDGAGQIEEAGHFRAPGTNASGAYWISCDVVYVVDYTRGLDVLRFKDPATECGAPPTAPAPAAQPCTGRAKPVIRLRRRGRRLIGSARPGPCGARIVRITVNGRRVRGTSRFSVRLPRGRRAVRVRAVDAFGNVSVRRIRRR